MCAEEIQFALLFPRCVRFSSAPLDTSAASLPQSNVSCLKRAQKRNMFSRNGNIISSVRCKSGLFQKSGFFKIAIQSFRFVHFSLLYFWLIQSGPNSASTFTQTSPFNFQRISPPLNSWKTMNGKLMDLWILYCTKIFQRSIARESI